MGRKKIEIKRITDERVRKVTFSKRKGGLLKKAMELSLLCDCEIGLVIFTPKPDQKLFKYATHSMENVVARYQSSNEAEESLHNGNYEGIYEKKGGPKLDSGVGGGIFNHPNSGYPNSAYQHPLAEQKKNLDMGSFPLTPTKVLGGSSNNLSVLIPGQDPSQPLLPGGPDSLLDHGSSLHGLMGLASPGLALASNEGLTSPNGFFSPSKWNMQSPSKGTTPGALANFSWTSPEKAGVSATSTLVD